MRRVCMFRVVELQTKLDDQMAERRSLADSASSPVDDELRDVSDTSFSSDRLPAFRPPLPPPLPPPLFYGYRPSPRFIPPFYGRRPPPPDRLHSPPAFDDPYVRESPRPRDVSPQARRRPLPPEHYRSAPPIDNHREKSDRGNSPPRGTSSPYYERHDGRRLTPAVDGYRNDELNRRPSPRARENSPRRRDWYSGQDTSRTPDDEYTSGMPSSSSRKQSHLMSREEGYQQSYEVGSGVRPTAGRSHRTRRSPADDDDYPTY